MKGKTKHWKNCMLNSLWNMQMTQSPPVQFIIYLNAFKVICLLGYSLSSGSSSVSGGKGAKHESELSLALVPLPSLLLLLDSDTHYTQRDIRLQSLKRDLQGNHAMLLWGEAIYNMERTQIVLYLTIERNKSENDHEKSYVYPPGGIRTPAEKNIGKV